MSWITRLTPAGFDFRSDTITTPTARQLSAVLTTTFGDDVYQECAATNALTARIATLFQKPSALFVLSGTMGNQLSLRALLGAPPYSVLCDSRAHIFTAEAGASSIISGCLLVPVTPSNGMYLTLEDIKTHITLSSDVHYAPTRVVALENTISGVVHPLDEVRRIGEWCRVRDVRVHLDGARLWDACADDPGKLAAYAEAVDALSVCMSKSLGAPVGSFVVGSSDFITHARHLRKTLGGGIRQAGVLTSMANVALDEVFFAGELTRAHALARRIAGEWKERGGEVMLPVDTNFVWLDLAKRGVGAEVWETACKEKGVNVAGRRVVTHWQICKKAVEGIVEAMDEVVRLVEEGKGGLEVEGDEKEGVKEKGYLGAK